MSARSKVKRGSGVGTVSVGTGTWDSWAAGAWARGEAGTTEHTGGGPQAGAQTSQGPRGPGGEVTGSNCFPLGTWEAEPQ